ncbi:uncharacterized protein METZ01_LOCUS515051, partial [marine metagenome]
QRRQPVCCRRHRWNGNGRHPYRVGDSRIHMDVHGMDKSWQAKCARHCDRRHCRTCGNHTGLRFCGADGCTCNRRSLGSLLLYRGRPHQARIWLRRFARRLRCPRCRWLRRRYLGWFIRIRNARGHRPRCQHWDSGQKPIHRCRYHGRLQRYRDIRDSQGLGSNDGASRLSRGRVPGSRHRTSWRKRVQSL